MLILIQNDLQLIESIWFIWEYRSDKDVKNLDFKLYKFENLKLSVR